MQVTVKNRQTLTDIATQYLGDASRAFEVAILNNLDMDDVAAGTVIELPEIDNYKQGIADLFGINAPASALSTFDNYEDEWQQYYSTGLPSSHE